MGLKDALRGARDRLLAASLRSAIREQGLEPVARRLEELVPDVSRQYTGFAVDSDYLRVKVRGQHAFQTALAQPEIETRPKAVVVDVGDSSGTHLTYLKTLSPNGQRRWLSVNLDAQAVEKIRARGLEALLARAEELDRHGVDADVFLSFETLEHLSDPAAFLHDLAAKTKCERLILTVPYVRRTRVGLHQLRAGIRKPLSAEIVHLFELSPEDLKLLCRHAGWKVERERVYLQYPRWSPLFLTKWLWRRHDFEGFYGLVLSRDDTWSSLYRNWR